MIFGVGLDLIEIERVVQACQKEHFLNRVFTHKERDEIAVQKKRAASNFAGKEAVVKMFGTGFGKIKANDVEILREESGRPYVVLYNEALKFAQENKIDVIHISITNTKELASAYVVGEMR